MANTRLTWQNVAAPDFSGAANAQRVAAESFDRAIGRIGEGLTQFDNIRKDAGDAAIMQNMMRYQDADALQAAIASGALTQGVDPAAIRASTLLKAQGQVGNLLDLSKGRQELATSKQSYDFNELANPLKLNVAELALGKDKYAFDRTKEADTRSDAERVAAQQAQLAIARGLQSGKLLTESGVADAAYATPITDGPGGTAMWNALVSLNPNLTKTNAQLGFADPVKDPLGGSRFR